MLSAARWSLLALLGLICLPALQAEPDETTFRNLVRKYFESNSSNEKQKVTQELGDKLGFEDGVESMTALEYTVLLRNENTETPVDPEEYMFQLGDEIRLLVKPMTKMYIYILYEGASGEQTCLLPTEAEVAPLAKPGKPLRLPEDGYFQFSPPAGEEKLIVVGTKEPVEDLASLAGAVFKKRESDLTKEEQEAKQRITTSARKTLQSMRQRLEAGTTFRGLLTDEALAKKAAETKQMKRETYLLEEPPTTTYRSTFSFAASRKGSDDANLVINIPLRSVDE